LYDDRSRCGFYPCLALPPTVSAKGKEKTPQREKVVALKEAKPVLSTGEGTTTPPQEAQVPEKERVVPAGGHKRREAREVEKIHPLAERGSWKDYGVWIGIGVLVALSLLVSLYLYVIRA
jgi:hypothetical protein